MNFKSYMNYNKDALGNLHRAIGEVLNSMTHEERMQLRFISVSAEGGGVSEFCDEEFLDKAA